MIIEITIGFLLFVVGYLVGRVDLIHRTIKDKHETMQAVAGPIKVEKTNKRNVIDDDTPTIEPPKISIDESKFVTTINTDSFQKDFEDLGERTVSEDNISSSVSKLSRLKRNKE